MKSTRQILKNQKGATLVEVMISVFVLSVGILSTLLYFTTAKAQTQLAADLTTATSHAEYILEDMRARTTLASITSEDWDAFLNASGVTMLTEEAVTVTYADAGADPLNITVGINWETNQRDHSVSLVTELTK